MKKIIFNCVPPFASNIPSAPFSILKYWLSRNGYDSSVIYWNLHLYKLQNDFIWNKPSVLGTSNQLGLHINYMLHKSGNQLSIEGFKKILQGQSPRYLSDIPNYYDLHISNFVDKMDIAIDTILSEINFSETLLFGFSMKLDGWIVSSIIADKIKKIAPDIPILIGGISTKEKARAFLESFPQFDLAIWGEGEAPLIKVVEIVESSNSNYEELINTAYRKDELVLLSGNKNKDYIDLSDKDIYPFYDDYFLQKKQAKIDIESILPIEGSRGCHWNKCKFCYLNTDYRYRVKSSEKICAEIKYMIDKYQIFSFEFLDNDFIGTDIEKFNGLINNLIQIKKEEPRFKIVIAEVITKGLDHSIIKRMFDAGIEFVQIGYESVSHNLLKKIHKKNTLASNFLYIKIAALYRVPLGHVNTIVNMPDETIEDILESVDNLKFLRFFLHPTNFKHVLIPVQVDYSSRYYKEIKNEITSWTPSVLAYDFLKEYVLSKDHWVIFDYIKQSRHYQWETFRNIEKYYLDNKHTYSVAKKDKTIAYSEFINGRKIYDFDIAENSLEAFILYNLNDKVMSWDGLCAKIERELAKKHSSEEIRKIVDTYYDKGLVYHTPDYSEIISVINMSHN